MRVALLLTSAFLAGSLNAQVIATGAMKRTMWEDQRSGLIVMDTLSMPGVYGMGPLEHLRGEITLVDGHCHVARIAGDSIVVVRDSTARAPFFVHGRVGSWKEIAVPDDVRNAEHLDAFLTRLDVPGPYFFRLAGRFAEVDLHVWDLPADSTFTGPEEGARYKHHFNFTGAEGQVLGVFSRHHRTVFTHHDAFIHLHFLSNDGRIMGHVDRLVFHPATITLMFGMP